MWQLLHLVMSWGWCHSHCAVGLYPALPYCWWKLSSTSHKHRPATISGTQGWVSGYGLLTLRGGLQESTQLNTNPAVSSFSRGKSRHQALLVCCTISLLRYLCGQPHSCHTVPQANLPGSSSAGQHLHHSVINWLGSVYVGNKKRHFLNELKRNQCESGCFCLNFTCAKEAWYLWILWLPGSISAYTVCQLWITGKVKTLTLKV